MTPHEKYCADMRSRGLEPTMSEKELHKAWGIQDEEFIPIVSRTHSKQRNIIPTFENHSAPTKTPIKINIIDQPKPIKKKLTKDELREHKRDQMRVRRQLLKDQGLTTKGTPKIYKERKSDKKTVTPRVKLSEEQRPINKRENQKRWYRNLVKRKHGRDVKDRTYMRLDGLTEAEKKERRLQQQRDSKQRKREELKNENDARRNVCIQERES